MRRIGKISNDEMNTASPQRLNGRGPYYGKMRPIYYFDAGMLATRTTENSLLKNGAREIGVVGIKIYTIGSGEVMKNRQSILTHRNTNINNRVTNPLKSDLT